MNSGSSPLK